MDIREEDVCVVPGYRLTEYQVFNGGDVLYGYFNFRNDQSIELIVINVCFQY